MKNAICKVLYVILFVVFVFTASLAAPIYSRRFYLDNIDSYASGQDLGEAAEAYNDMMDYLTLHKDFSLGSYEYSQEGKAHFEDCQRLFDINLSFLVISIVGIVILLTLEFTKKISLKMWGGLHASFYAALLALILPLIAVAVCAINFDEAFTLMHKILFPGKENWIFSSASDPIITILPQEYFLSCGILAVGVLAGMVGVSVIISIIKMTLSFWLMRRRVANCAR